MSVKFREDGYSIDIYTCSNPTEAWIGLQKELLTLISEQPDDCEPPWRAAAFLKELLPDWEDAKKMVNGS